MGGNGGDYTRGEAEMAEIGDVKRRIVFVVSFMYY